MKLSLSTCWCSHRHSDGYEMVREMVDLGFSRIELSHGIRVTLVPGILKAVDEGLVTISSVHNFCPLPAGVMGAMPNLYQPSSKYPQEIELWKRHTERTLDFAKRVGADLMVCHSGSVPFWFGNPGKKLEEYREAHPQATPENDPKFAKLHERMLRRMQAKQRKFLEQLVASYQLILPRAQERKVRIGVENREDFTELPLDTEMVGLLARLGEPEVFGYWHDTGHAQIKERLGACPHRRLLAENSARQFGFHLHDVSIEDRDHQQPGTGTIDWPMVRSFIRPEHLLVIELSPRLKPEQVVASREFLEGLIAPGA